MFTLSDLMTLTEAAPAPGVSVFLPTHVLGRETRQDPIRLKNLLGEAQALLRDGGMAAAEAALLLAPATELVGDHAFWQHQSHALALFLDHDGMRSFKVPLALEERVFVGEQYLVKPLLPILSGDGVFHVLTISDNDARLYVGTRFSMAEEAAGLPGSLGEVQGESSDYENPVNASPANRSSTTGAGASQARAQVHGDSPEEWRKAQRIAYLHRIAGTVDAHLAAHPLPLVLVADSELAGNFPRIGALGRLVAGTVTTTPAGMSEDQIHAAAYALMQPHLDAARQAARERFAALQGSGDARAVTVPTEIVVAAHQGRVDTLLAAEGVDLAGRFDSATQQVVLGQGGDLPDLAVAQTLNAGGAVHVLPRDEMPRGAELAAIMRY